MRTPIHNVYVCDVSQLEHLFVLFLRIETALGAAITHADVW